MGPPLRHDLPAVQALFQAAQVIQFVKKPALADMIAKRVDFTGYRTPPTPPTTAPLCKGAGRRGAIWAPPPA